MKRKNRLKNNINFCFICAKKFKNIKEKHGHRINPKKGNSENNLVILCEQCKKYFQNNRDIKVYEIKISKEVRDKYFSNIDNKNKQIILQKIREFRWRKINDDKKNSNRI